jgi:hypothetical protein
MNLALTPALTADLSTKLQNIAAGQQPVENYNGCAAILVESPASVHVNVAIVYGHVI